MTTDLPKQVDRKVAALIRQLPEPWSLIKKRDHYFIHAHNGQRLCVGNNGNKPDEHLNKFAIRSIKKILEAANGNRQ
jgi:hypothetical protein